MEENELPATSLLGITLKGIRVLESWVKMPWKERVFNTEKLYPDGTDCRAVDSYEGINTTHVFYCLVQRNELTGDKRLAECSEFIPGKFIAVPSYFVPHAWEGLFHRLIRGDTQFLTNASESTAVWIDW